MDAVTASVMVFLLGGTGEGWVVGCHWSPGRALRTQTRSGPSAITDADHRSRHARYGGPRVVAGAGDAHHEPGRLLQLPSGVESSDTQGCRTEIGDQRAHHLERIRVVTARRDDALLARRAQ